MISINGVNTLLEDEDGHFSAWLSKCQSIDDLRLFCEVPAAIRSFAGVSRSCKGGGPGLIRGNYPRDIPPRLNTLYWPTGAARWAYGLFLATEEQKNAIGAQSLKTLIMADGLGGQITSDMWLLPPRKISSFATTNDSKLWLIPLVDDRYWWQFRVVENLEVTWESTWDDVYDLIDASLGITIERSSFAGFLSPDPVELSRRFGNAAVLLDAAAMSVGHRVVRLLDGTVRSQSATDAGLSLAGNLARPAKILAGGDTSDVEDDSAPQNVLVSFRKSKCSSIRCPREEYTIEATPTNVVYSPTDTKKLVKSTAYAETSTGTTPSNLATLQSLATAISEAYYAWLTAAYDTTYIGVLPWEPNGFDNYAEWSLGRRIPTGHRLAQMRVQSMPTNFDVEQQLSQDPALKVSDCCGDMIRFKLTANLALAGTTTAIEIKSGPGYEEMGDEFAIKDPWDDPGCWREDLPIHEDGQGYRGFSIVPPCPELDENGDPIQEIVYMEQIARSITFTLTSDMGGGSATATVDNYYLGKDPSEVFVPMVVYDPQGQFPLALAGCKGKARYNDRDHRYEAVVCDQMVTRMRCVLTNAMCLTDATGGLSGHVALTGPPHGYMPPSLPSSGLNSMPMEGMSGDTCTVEYNYTSGEWEIENVGLHRQYVADGLYYSSCQLLLEVMPVAIHRCSVDPSYGVLQLYSHTYMKELSFDSQNCRIVAEVGNFCGFAVESTSAATQIQMYLREIATGDYRKTVEMGGSGDTEVISCKIQQLLTYVCLFSQAEAEEDEIWGTVLTATEVELVQDVYDNADCVVKVPHTVWVVCDGTDQAEGDVFCPIDCP